MPAKGKGGLKKVKGGYVATTRAGKTIKGSKGSRAKVKKQIAAIKISQARRGR